MNRIEIIQNLINKFSYKSYAEVGVQSGHCFNAIQCETKIGVDPDPSSAATFFVTSDEFFDTIMPNIQRPYTIKDDKGERTINVPEKFAIYFSDGLHHSENSERK